MNSTTVRLSDTARSKPNDICKLRQWSQSDCVRYWIEQDWQRNRELIEQHGNSPPSRGDKETEMLKMSMTSKKRMRIIQEATAAHYFAMLDSRQQKQMSRNEKNALRFRARELRTVAIESQNLRNNWNAAAIATGHKDKMFKVSEG